MNDKFRYILVLVLALLLAQFATGLARAQSGAGTDLGDSAADSTRDPFEKVNRAIYGFNTELDRLVLKPVAEAYLNVVPQPARNCVGNIFSNVGDVGNALNNALQGKVLEALSDVCRLAINSTLGIFGCFDVASEVGFDKHREDFGQTLAVWGVRTGPYLMLPVLGPSSVRDAIGQFSVDTKVDVVRNINHVPTRNEFLGIRIVEVRAGLMAASNIIDNAALDPYVFVRDAYFQRRRSQVYDGDPPSGRDEARRDSERKGDAMPVQATLSVGVQPAMALP
jgi:phospholipid-binding lipoprotein MlaA